MANFISVTPLNTSSGSTVTVTVDVSAMNPPPATVSVGVTDGLGHSTSITVGIDQATGIGDVSWQVPTLQEWPGMGVLTFSLYGAQDFTITVS